MSPFLLPFTRRYITWTLMVGLTGVLMYLFARHPTWSIYLAVPLFITAFLSAIGLHDFLQKRRSILRNYPIAAHIRFLLEDIRPEIRQYFIEDDKRGTPFSRDERSVIYQRAKNQLDKRPFGTQIDVYADGYEWLNHSMAPKPVRKDPLQLTIGGPDCTQPYKASILNISAMSFGALSANAIMALNKGAKIGGFAHVTGEGGVSKYHEEHAGDLSGRSLWLFWLPQRGG